MPRTAATAADNSMNRLLLPSTVSWSLMSSPQVARPSHGWCAVADPRTLQERSNRVLEAAFGLCHAGSHGGGGHLSDPRTARGTDRRSTGGPVESPRAGAARGPAPERRRGRLDGRADRLRLG